MIRSITRAQSRFTARFGSLLALVVLGAVTGIAMPSSSGAAAVLGSLSVNPATGTAGTPISLTTVSSGAAKGCPSPATNIVGYIDGPGGWSNILGVQNTNSGVTAADDINVQLADNFGGLAQSNGIAVVAGKYTVTVRCINRLGSVDYGDYTTSLWFTSANAYQDTDPNAPVPTPTTTVLAAAPASTAVAGAAVKLTATVSPVAAAGAVQFTDTVGGTTANIGAAVPVAGGVASASTTTLTQGSHSLKAVFTPAAPGSYTGSTSTAIAYSITAPVNPAAPTSTTIGVTPAAGAVAGAPVTITASVSPAAAAGTIQFSDTVGVTASNLGSPVSVSGGSASLTTSSLGAASHSLKAVFTPADAAAYLGSSSAPLAYVVTAPTTNPTTTTTTLNVSPSAGAAVGDPVTLSASVSPAGAAGSVQFVDGSGASAAPLGSAVAVNAGKASTSTTALAAGAHSLRAIFTPSDAAAFAASTSSAVPYQVTAANGPTTTSVALTASPSGQAVAGSPVTLIAKVNPAAGGTIAFTRTPAGGVAGAIGTPVAVSNGTATLTVSDLPVGALTIGASFTPADPTRFTASTAGPLSYTVTQAGVAPQKTSTSMAAAPTGAIVAGAQVRFTVTVAPSSATGSVQFTDTLAGTTTPISAPVPVQGGTAALSTSFSAAGQHAVQARFSPSDPAAFETSVSGPLAITVTSQQNPQAKDTSVRLTVWRTGWCPEQDRKEVDERADGRGWHVRRCAGAVLVAQVKPGTAGGAVQFTDTRAGKTSPVGAPVTVSNGWAVLFTAVSPGRHLGAATFVPADRSAYNSSTSNQVSVSGGLG